MKPAGRICRRNDMGRYIGGYTDESRGSQIGHLTGSLEKVDSNG
jgi:hypothetical protein